jgi:hypothetical protein
MPGGSAMSLLEEALKYHADKMPVFPVARNKFPLVKWKQFQARLPTEEEIRE